jgi:hypothetical protein
MQAMISLGVENAHDNAIVAFNPVEHLVQKAPRWQPPETAII